MRSVLVDSSAERRLVIADADEPVPTSSEALIRVSSFSLNLGETRRTQVADDGWRPGWDLAGTVEAAAADGSGPPPVLVLLGSYRPGLGRSLWLYPPMRWRNYQTRSPSLRRRPSR